MNDSSAVSHIVRVVGVLYCLVAASCAGVERVPPQAPPQAESQTAPIPVAEPPSGVATQPAPTDGAKADVAPAQPDEAEPAETEPATASLPPAPVVVEPVRPAAPTVVPRVPAPNVAVTQPPAPQAAAAKPSTAVVTAPAPSIAKPAAAPVPDKPPAPSLDLASLETRLRETKAIGVFTKISLKNQVDDLLGQFRAYHKRQAKTTLAELRQSYDLLLLKVLSLLQDSDPPLARDIVRSRAAIWGILSNPQKFTEANLMAGATP